MKIRILILGILVAVFLISSHLKGQGPQTRTKLIKEVFHTYTQEEGVHNAFFQIESAAHLIKLNYYKITSSLLPNY